MASKPPAVVLFSHGSLLCGSGAALDFHGAAIRRLGRFAAVEAGYLNYSEPPIEVAVERCLSAGADHIVIVPYFLIAGKFVTVDLPARLEMIRQKHPGARFTMARAVEDAPQMTGIIGDLLTQAVDPGDWQPLALGRARERCELRESCPIYGSELCRAGAGAEAGDVVGRDADLKLPVDSAGKRRKEECGLLMILHGSPRPEANAPAVEIAGQLSQRGDFGYVDVAYLECNEPGISKAISAAYGAGVRLLEVVPYFLHPGRHLVIDIPGALLAAGQAHPDMDIRMSPSIGESGRLFEVLVDRIEEAVAAG